MFSRIWLINFVLMVGVVFFGIKTLGVWTEEGLPSPEIQAVKGPAAKMEMKKSIQSRAVSEIVYESVASMNLFSSDRKEPRPEVDDSGTMDKARESREGSRTDALLKNYVLYGVVIVNDYKSALIKNSRPKPGDAQIKNVKVGDSVGDFNVAEIKSESIVLTMDGNHYEINLYDKDRSKERRIETKAATKLPPDDGKSDKQNADQKIKDPNQRRKFSIFGPEPEVEKSEQESHDKKDAGEEEYKIIKTPFGEIKQRVR
ncbi:MAG: hypothetical protein JXA35_06270 [Deltaproteobacteria bacterium]|nr:hypothetical protein [Deltaproteobacteria bacterium]